jgi:hypothetical protein
MSATCLCVGTLLLLYAASFYTRDWRSLAPQAAQSAEGRPISRSKMALQPASGDPDPTSTVSVSKAPERAAGLSAPVAPRVPPTGPPSGDPDPTFTGSISKAPEATAGLTVPVAPRVQQTRRSVARLSAPVSPRVQPTRSPAPWRAQHKPTRVAGVTKRVSSTGLTASRSEMPIQFRLADWEN